MKTPPDFEKARVVIVEDHPMFREHLALLINREADLVVCGQAENVQDGFALVQRLRPQLVLVDISLKGRSGLELLKDLRAHDLNVPALVLSMHDESIYAERALRAGAKGYITKHEASDQVMTAIRQVLAGELYLESRFMARMLSHAITGEEDSPRPPLARLTDRELEVFELIGLGQTTRQIGLKLGISLTTIDTYRARIKAKLNIENAAQLHSQATRWIQERTATVS